MQRCFQLHGNGLFETGCRLLRNLDSLLDDAQVEALLPRLEAAITIDLELEPERNFQYRHAAGLAALETLAALGPRAAPALEKVQVLSARPMPQSTFTNHGLIEFLGKARAAEAAIRVK